MAELSILPQTTEVPEAWIDRIFVRLSGMYGNRFNDMWSGCAIAEVKSTWADGLSGYSVEEIRRGLAECMKLDWPPTLPQFLKLCRPAMDYESAYAEACEQINRRRYGKDKWSHPAIFWAAAELGSDLTSFRYGDIKGRWRNALDAALHDVGAGSRGDVPAPAPALPETLPCSKEEAAANLQRLKEMIK
jgi:hypothetical protein